MTIISKTRNRNKKINVYTTFVRVAHIMNMNMRTAIDMKTKARMLD